MEVNACSRRAWLPVTAALIIVMSAFGTYSSVAVAAHIKATLKTAQRVSSVRSTESDSGSIPVGAGESFSGRVTTSSATLTVGQIHEWATGQNAPVVIALMQTGDTYRFPADAKLSDAQFAIFGDAAPPVLPLFLVAVGCFVVPIGVMRIMFSHGVLDTDIARILPSFTTALKSWNGRDLPPEAAYAALIADLRASREAEMPASAATRLNYGTAGFRSLLCTTDAGAAVDPGGEVRGQLNGNRVSLRRVRPSCTARAECGETRMLGSYGLSEG